MQHRRRLGVGVTHFDRNDRDPKRDTLTSFDWNEIGEPP
jgi:hypothetical protein